MKNEPQLSAEMEKRFDENWHKLTGCGEEQAILWLKAFLATALEEQKKEATFTLMNTTKPFFDAGYDAGKKDERQKALSELESSIEQVCQDEEVHCDYFCNTCGGVKEFLVKLRAKLAEMKK